MTSVKKSTQLRQLLTSSDTEFMLEAHNGISARLVEEVGFKGIWASGLALSAQFGVRDNNEASWTQVVDMLEFMSDATRVPILLDGDTGYGNFNNMRRLVRKLEQRDVAGVCIEDKLFPKTNSFIAGEKQPLANVEEFCGKIAAGKDSQTDEHFNIVARVEALIAGWDVGEALRRAEAYYAAGADAILIHSKLAHPDQILTFAREWANRAPLVIVPTKYYSTPVEVFRKAHISLVIWANHMIRAAIAAMKNVAEQIHAQESLIEVEDRIAPVDEIFRLQGAAELQLAEERYFSSRKTTTSAVVLGATRGAALHNLTAAKPKVMIPIGGKPLLRRLVDKFKKRGIDDIRVVAGYKAETIDVNGVSVIVNEAFDSTGELASLQCARNYFSDDMLVLYGDLLFRSYILRDLIEHSENLTVVVDSSQRRDADDTCDFAYCSETDDRSTWGQAVTLEKIMPQAQTGSRVADGRWIGMLHARSNGRAWLESALTKLARRQKFKSLSIPDLLNEIVAAGHDVHVWYIHGHWIDINSLSDLELAGSFSDDT